MLTLGGLRLLRREALPRAFRVPIKSAVLGWHFAMGELYVLSWGSIVKDAESPSNEWNS